MVHIFCNLNLTSVSYSFWNKGWKVLKFYKFDEKRAITPRLVIRFTSKLLCWSFLPHVRFLILLTVFELLPKTCNFTIYSIFSNSGHVGWCTASPDTILKLDTLVMIQRRRFLKKFTTDDDDGRQELTWPFGSGDLKNVNLMNI